MVLMRKITLIWVDVQPDPGVMGVPETRIYEVKEDGSKRELN